MKLFSCLNVVGGDNLSMASVLIKGVVPSLSFLYPRHSICLRANIHFSIEMARFSSLKFFRTCRNVFLCTSFGPLVTISMSSRYAYMFLQFVSVRSIAFWNSAGKSVRP